ncbi:hypothetical protein P153DRAFT_383213 [Dothidotthia symphoricarpi CBS 119687]|uniref:Uncharacterized protein n=1 Tax=Dothidotthia symphoricarpi CBS 119687 TaxID=1392245 RepID=A0A6A6AML0_9PLEO|nr:uncharacterized protein P153DRAFT_383213 [Dothidotthia symphoricarpi CBS 119687]KAF2132325.1 hypothetical protein P153DRAFT_383213 [Dothidotthia symphoricarpi CBS 119687]
MSYQKMEVDAHAAIKTTQGTLQEAVLVVSLVRTLTSSFGSAVDLYRKLKRRGHDEEDDTKDHYRTQSRRRRDSALDHAWDRHHHPNLKVGSRKDHYGDSDEKDLTTSSFYIQAEYDRGYRELGEKFARGDLMTQVQLQSQIIQLEQTLLSIYSDLMLSTYILPSHTHLARLVQTTRSARVAAIQALKMQYQRIHVHVQPEKPEVHRPMPGAFPLPTHAPRPHEPSTNTGNRKPKRKARSRSSDSSGSAQTLIPRSKPKPHPHANKLFCVYARDLQGDLQLPLVDNYKTGGNNKCPFCHAHASIRPGKAWEVVMNDRKKHDKHGRGALRKFMVGTRFVIKCHREWGGFACVLCAQFKEADTVCRGVEALVEHLWREHTGEELAKEEDIAEVD